MLVSRVLESHMKRSGRYCGFVASLPTNRRPHGQPLSTFGNGTKRLDRQCEPQRALPQSQFGVVLATSANFRITLSAQHPAR